MEKNILVLGAGKSATYLLEYLRDHCKSENWNLSIADVDTTHLIAAFPNQELINLNVSTDHSKVEACVQKSSLVVSMVPASMHPIVAKACLKFKKNLITPSYVSEELKAMHSEVLESGLLFLNEMGVDPGIDHMSAMQIIHRLKEQGADILSFESYCGGLIAPESDTNPWHYKFTWNPRNVILAGQGVAKYLLDGTHKYIPYHTLFERTDHFEIGNYGSFEAYANRDSLKYISAYGLDDIQTMYRGTFRRPPFCEAWQIFVKLGMCDDSYQMDIQHPLTAGSFLSAFIGGDIRLPLRERFMKECGLNKDSMLMPLFDFIGLFDEKQILEIGKGSPAQILQCILEKHLSLHEGDKDMLVMLHKFEYHLAGKKHALESSMVVLGEDEIHTAMAKTVGLPIAIACKLILNATIQDKGVLIPVNPSIYLPIMHELQNWGIQFTEKEV